MTTRSASLAETACNRLWFYGLMVVSGILVGCSPPPNPAQTAATTQSSVLTKIETRIRSLERQSIVLDQMQKELNSVQQRIEELEKLQENIQEIKQLERNQNQLLLEYQEEFEDRMTRLETNLERNTRRFRQLTGKEQLQDGASSPSEQMDSKTGSVQELDSSRSGDSAVFQEPPAPPPSVEQQFETAWELYNTKQFFKAIELLREFRVKHPDHPSTVDAHYLLGDAYYSMQDYPSAAIELYEFVEQNSHHPSASDARWKLAQSLEKSGEIGLALSIYQELASQDDSPYRKRAQEKLAAYENQQK